MQDWTYNGKPVLEISDMPEGTLGFIYRLTNLETGRQYIGRKSVLTRGAKVRLGKKEKMLPENKRKTFKYVDKEIKDWKKYLGSNDIIIAEAEAGSEFSREIIRFCDTKKQIAYYEAKYLFCEGVIETDDYYNSNIQGHFFRRDLTDVNE